MLKHHILILILSLFCCSAFAQQDSSKKRLDFAKSYLEIGGNYTPSFSGSTFENSASVNPYLNWGSFHFWGHAEFYVKFPLGQNNLNQEEATDFQLTHYVTTGARFLPWAYQEKKIRPFMGLGWSALDYKQIILPMEDQPTFSKNFMLNYNFGFLYGAGNFSLRAGMNYLPNNKWNYPISKTIFEEIETPNINFHFGILYAFDMTKDTDDETIDRWNKQPTLSKTSLNATKSSDFFIGAGPSLSYSLSKSEYTQSQFPYLNNMLASSNYFDFSLGYHFNKIGLFTALSFRNPKYETEGYGSKQTIQKNSLTFELNTFLTDYSGFAPFIGLNIAYDWLKYTEEIDDIKRELEFKQINPGVTIGWDILPGKTEEALILRTNLRWYPFSSFEVDEKKFDFSQLEYNLIQVIFYPGRFKRKKK